MKRILHLVLTYALLINGTISFAQKISFKQPEIQIMRDEENEIIKIIDAHHCPYDISDNKKHVVIQGYTESSSYYWSEETGIIPFEGYGFAVTDEGVVAGWFTNESYYNVAGLWYPETQEWEFLGMNPDVPEFADFEYNSAWSMSNDGKKVGVMQFDAAWNTFTYLWSEEDGYVKLSNGNSSVTRPNGMNRDGSVVAGYYVDSMGFRAPCYWLGSEMYKISNQLGESMNVSPDGNYVCGGLKDSEGNAFIYDIANAELIIIDNILAVGGSMTAMCVTDDGDAFGYVSTGAPADYDLRKGFAYVEGELMSFEDFLMTNGVKDAENWNVYSVNNVTPDGKSFIGAANMKGQDYTFALTIAESRCDAPENLTYTVDDNIYNNIILNWEAPENPVDVTYEIYTSYNSIDPIYTGITETSFTIENLEAGHYTFLVKANWRGDCLSNPSNAVNMTVYPCAPEEMCELTFNMLDGYGDGWNGAYIDIKGAYTDFDYKIDLKNEGLDTVVKNLPLCPDTYTFIWNRGEFDEEISFTIVLNGKEICRIKEGDIDALFDLNFLVYDVSCDEIVTDVETKDFCNIYPNPVNEKLYIYSENEIMEVRISNVTGTVVRCKRMIANGQQPIDISDLNSGVYFVKVKFCDDEMIKKIIKL